MRMRQDWPFYGALLVLLSGLVVLGGLNGSTAQAQSSSPGEAWECSLDAVGATLTLCETAKSGYRMYLTDVVMQSATATGGLMLVRYGTGSACGTGTVSLLPSAAAVPRLAYPANTAATTHINLQTPLSTAKETDICVICTVTNTCTVQLSGYAAP